MKDITFTTEWDEHQWYCYCSKYGKYACYGLGLTPVEAMQSLLEEIPIFEQVLKSQE